MSKFSLTALAVLLLSTTFITDVRAEEKAEKSAEAAATDTVKALNEEGLSPAQAAKKDALTEKVTNILKGLDLMQVQHFTVIYANYMVLSMVNTVQDDVGKAVDGCKANNKELEGDMTKRFDDWKTALQTPKQDSLANINSMIAAQNYLPKAEFDEIFALVDETRAQNSTEFGKIPVTTPEACKYMIGKMDETQKQMTQLLQTTLVTYPDMLKTTQE